MPCIWGNFGPAGIIIQAAVIPSDVDEKSRPSVLRVYNALIDTGATSTAITARVVSEVGLSPIGKRDMISASHVTSTNNYLFQLGIPSLSQQPTGQVAGSITLFEGINGIEFNAGPAAFDILVGMDVIRKGALTVSFDGHFTFCW